MGSFKDLPRDNPVNSIQNSAELAFEHFVKRNETLFALGNPDRGDYGADYQLEVKEHGRRTNLRACIQLKGSDAVPNADGSVSVSVDGSNLSYLVQQAHSLYVCFNLRADKLLVRPAEDVYRQYMARGEEWMTQGTLTIRFSQVLDEAFLSQLHRIMLEVGRGERSRRLDWAASPPEQLSTLARKPPQTITVPLSQNDAFLRLRKLYDAGEDLLISRAFEQFVCVLGAHPEALDCLYMAETNLGLNGYEIQRNRLEQGLEHFRIAMLEKRLTPESVLYCMGNAQLALRNYEGAVRFYESALSVPKEPSESSGVFIAAQCRKNMGSALECLGRHQDAHSAFKSALSLEPDLGEAHFALALWHKKHDGDLKTALQHFDAISTGRGSALSRAAIDGWCAEIHFLLNDSVAAFRAINSIVGHSDLDGWEWGWCARLVSEHGRKSASAARSAFTFWRRYCEHHAESKFAEAEKFFCAWYIHSNDERSSMSFSDFQKLGQNLAAVHVLEEAFVFDKIAHWAQDDGDLSAAEIVFRQAYEKNPDMYGCCFGTLLNRIARHEDALVALLHHAKRHRTDAVNWFQIAYAREKLGKFLSAVNGYRKAIKYDENYDSAWFNLGGVLWNNGATAEALIVWSQAVQRFPEHSLTKHLVDSFPVLTGSK